MNLSDKLIVNAAITGCVLTQADNPYLPATQAEIVACASCASGGSVDRPFARPRRTAEADL